MKKVLNKKLDEKAMFAGMFAFAALGFLYLYVAATVNNTEAPTKERSLVSQNIETSQETQSAENGIKKYRSNLLKVEFEYPEKYSIEEKVTTIVLRDKSELSGEIIFSKYGTNFEDVKSHVDSVITKKTIPPTTRKQFVTANMMGESVSYSKNGIEDRQTIYFVHNFNVAHFSTLSSSLFQDLETIAKSFKILE